MVWRIKNRHTFKVCRIKNRQYSKSMPILNSAYFTAWYDDMTSAFGKVCRIKNRHTFKSMPILNSAYFTECRFVIRHITQTETQTETELLRRHSSVRSFGVRESTCRCRFATVFTHCFALASGRRCIQRYRAWSFVADHTFKKNLRCLQFTNNFYVYNLKILTLISELNCHKFFKNKF